MSTVAVGSNSSSPTIPASGRWTSCPATSEKSSETALVVEKNVVWTGRASESSSLSCNSLFSCCVYPSGVNPSGKIASS